MKRLATVVCASLFPLLAAADPQTADQWYKQGENEYNLGNFEKAAEAFKQGYALESNEAKKPIYLYNVAQAFRQANKCRDAEFFYKRFLALKDADTVKPLKATTRTEIEGFITQLDACVKQQEAITNQRPTTVAHPDDTGSPPSGTTGTPGTATGTGGTHQASPTTVAATDSLTAHADNAARPTDEVRPVLSARLSGGISKISAGGLPVPVQAAFTLFVGHPLHLGPKLGLDVGGLVGFSAVPFVNEMSASKETATFTSLLADAGVEYGVAPKIEVRGDLGLGVFLLGGLSEIGSPFTDGGRATSGALAMFAARIAASGEYELTPKLLVTATPAFAFSPAKTGLRTDIKSITHFDFMIGVGYRM